MHVISFGELLWDLIRGNAHIGGAPFNLAAHLSKLGARSALISAVGSDPLGTKALEIASSFGMDTRFIRVDRRPTGTVEVALDAFGSPRYIIHENTAWDTITIDDTRLRLLVSAPVDAFCFGTLAQRSRVNRNTLTRLLSLLRPRHVFYDVNLRDNFYTKDRIDFSLRRSTIVKLNDDECVELSRMLFTGNMKERAFAAALSAEYDIPVVCITRGAQGAAVYHDGLFEETPGVPVKVADTVGAGDAFGAGFLFSLLSGRGIGESSAFAGRLGAYVASCPGAVPEYDIELRKEIDRIRITMGDV